MSFSVLAIIAARNEADILPWVIRHLRAQGVSVSVIDNHSTDDTYALASRHAEVIEVFPEQPSATFDWARILRRKEFIADGSSADWIMHCDADEIRVAPWTCDTLLTAIQKVDAEGYNAIDHALLNYAPVSETYGGQNPEEYFTELEPRCAGDSMQIKTWKNVGKVDLASSGGHSVQFDGRRVYPQKFFSKHYPFRSFSQRREKLADRFARWNPAERARGWHVQYDHLVGQEL